jgi:DNA repair protein RadC
MAAPVPEEARRDHLRRWYVDLTDFVLADVRARYEAAGVPCDGETVAAIGATLFIATCRGGRVSPRRVRTELPGEVSRAAALQEALASRRRSFREIPRRCAEVREEGVPLRSAEDVYAAYRPRLEGLTVEEFHVAVLDSQHRLERDVTVTRGVLDESLVHPRKVFREAIAERAAAVILIHNHPSGDPTPSAEDRVATEQLVAAGRLLDIPVHDNIVNASKRFGSLVERGWI